MDNNAKLGFTFQAMVCNKYDIIPETDRAINTFNSAYDPRLEKDIEFIIDEVFDFLKLYPIECTTFKKEENAKYDVPYNFILNDNSTLSIRTNFSSKMVAPRRIGQAGYKVLNEYFSDIYGKEIKDQEDIKKLFYYNIIDLFPIYIDHLLDADYIVWIFQEKCEYKYRIVSKDSGFNFEYKSENFQFTKKCEDWSESINLRYIDKKDNKSISIANIQVHSKRTFKFRFNMKNLINFLYVKQKNNETLGITAEKTICDLFHLEYPKNFFKRYSVELQYQLEDVINYAFQYLPSPIKHSGSEVGIRGGLSKSPFDFILRGNKTLSLKTNIGKLVCPPEVGQPSAKTCYFYFKDFLEEDYIDKTNFKQMVYNHIDKLIPIYLSHMFDSDYLLRIYENNKKDCLITGQLYGYDIVTKDFGKDFIWEKGLFTFSKKDINDWNVSNTVYYNKVQIGEYEVHNSRNCFKFRFYFNNLLEILKKKK